MCLLEHGKASNFLVFDLHFFFSKCLSSNSKQLQKGKENNFNNSSIIIYEIVLAFLEPKGECRVDFSTEHICKKRY